MSAISPAIRALAAQRLPDADELKAAFDALMDGEAEPAETGAFLVGLAAIGETPGVLSIGAKAMRARMLRVEAPDGAIDTCGTGGDARGTWNISTAAALVAAGAGAIVAKHGNKAASSKSGSAEILEALGVNLTAPPDAIARALDEAGVAFLFAQAHHGAVRHVAAARRALGVRTVFNLLGPLSNPAGARRQLLGVFDARWLIPVAEALRDLGAERAFVVHGGDGLDEITTTGETQIAELTETGDILKHVWTPEMAGLPRAPLSALQGGTPQENAAALRALLAGERSAYRDIVALNAAAALVLAGRAADLEDGARQAEAAIDDGRAARALEALVAASRSGTP
jgi:anthranilate phosphoribosyltransferase